MPELPEVELMTRLLARHTAGRRLLAVEALDPRILPEGPGGLPGARVGSVGRRGKLSVLVAGDEALLLHFRMTGALLALPDPEARPPHLRLRLRLDGPGVPALGLVDPRRFATAERIPAGELPARLARLGPEPWPEPLSGPALAARFLGRRGPVKPALLEGARVAGIGNILASEALFRAGIHPARPVQGLDESDWARLAGVLTPLIDQVLAAEEASFDDQRGIAYVNLGGPNPFAIYDRAGEPCPACGTPIERVSLAGRGTWLCPRCQPLTPAPAQEETSRPLRRRSARTRSSSSSGSKGLGR